MKKIVKSTYGNLYLDAAEQIGCSYRVEDKGKSIAYISNGTKEIRFKSHSLGLNPKSKLQNSKHKGVTSTLLSKKDIPVPAFEVFKDQEVAVKYACDQLEASSPVVIKPNNASEAKGVRVNPTTKKQIHEAILDAFSYGDAIIVEDYIDGHHYRITLLDGEIIAVTQRIPSYVTSDGIHTVKELIDLKNKQRSKKNLPLIRLRVKDYDYLKDMRRDLSTVYADKERIVLQPGCDYDIGGERKRVFISSIPDTNKEMFVEAVKTLGLRYGGVDYISPDITQEYTGLRTAINEVNSSPHQDVHYYGSYPPNNYSSKRILRKLMS